MSTTEVIQDNSAVTDSGFIKNLPNLLRLMGTGVLLVAMYSFLVKGWQSGNDVFRYLMMLGHTGALAAIGVASGHLLKEGKGARLLLTLALVSVPANFAILGGFVLSQTPLVGLYHYPSYVAWSVDSPLTAVVTLAGALVVLIPVTRLGFAVLARGISSRLTLMFLLSNSALILPLRDPHLVGALVLGLSMFSIVFIRQTSNQQIATKTQEGLTAIGLQFLPLAILMGRSLWLYSLDQFMMTVLAISLFFVLRQASAYLENGSGWRNLMDAVSVIPSVAILFLLTDALVATTLLAPNTVIPLAAIASGAMIYDISRRSKSYGPIYRHLAAAILLIAVFANQVNFGGFIPAVLSICVGFGLMVIGYRQRQRSVFTSGATLTMIGLGQQVLQLIHHFDLGSWIALALIGIAAIVVASVIESQGGKVRERFDHLRMSLKQWEQ